MDIQTDASRHYLKARTGMGKNSLRLRPGKNDQLLENGLFRFFVEIPAFLAAIKQLLEHFCSSVCRPSVCYLFFHNVPLIVSSRNSQELLPMTEVMSMQKVKARGQRSRSQRSKPNLADFDLNWAFRDCNSSLNSPMDLKWCTKLDVL